MSEIKSVLLAPDIYNWKSEKNVAVGSRVGNTSDFTRRIKPSTGDKQAVGPVSWNTSFPDGLVDSVQSLNVKGSFVVAGTLASLKNSIGLANMAINRCIPNATLEQNGKKWACSPAEMVDVFCLANDTAQNALLSQVSRSDDYSLFDQTLNNNPLNSGGNVTDSIDTRGLGANYITSITELVADASYKITFDVTEALLVNPLQYSDVLNAQPFRNINSYILNLQMNITPQKFINKSVGDAISDFEISSYELVVRTFKPSVKIMSTLPKTLVYNSPIIESKQVVSQTLPANSEPVVNFNNITLNGVPSMFCVIATQTKKDYGPILQVPLVNISIDTDNQSNLLSYMQPDQLYKLSSKNGLNKRPAVFYGQAADPTQAALNFGVGSPFYFRPSDLPLDETTVANVNKTINMSMKLTYKNQTAEAMDITVRLFTFTDNFVFDTEGTFTEYRPLMTAEQMLKSPLQMTEQNSEMQRVLGGNWWRNAFDNTVNFLRSPFAKDSSKFLRNNLPGAREFVGDETPFGRFASSYGYGKKPASRKKKGGEIVKLGNGKKGGKAMKHSDLEQYLDI